MTNKKKLNRPPPDNVAEKDSPNDYTGRSADERVFFINLGFMKFGTSDKFQGASMFILVILSICLTIASIVGFYSSSDKVMSFIDWGTFPLLLTIGAAIGRSVEGGDNN